MPFIFAPDYNPFTPALILSMVKHLTLKINLEVPSSNPSILFVPYTAISVYVPRKFSRQPDHGAPQSPAALPSPRPRHPAPQAQAAVRGGSRGYRRACACFPESPAPTQTPRPSRAGELKLHCLWGLGGAQAHSGGGAGVFPIISAPGRASESSRRPERASAGPLCGRLESRPRRLTRAQAPPRA